MIYLLNIFTVFGLSLLSLSVFPHIRILGVIPFIVPFFLITLAYFRKGFEPVLLAALAGIFFDLFSSYSFGLYLFLFLFIALVVKIMFQEGMRSLSFWYYSIISTLFFLAFYISQFVILYFGEVTFNIKMIWPVLWSLIVNGICVILVYVFSDWYFDKINVLEDSIKRR